MAMLEEIRDHVMELVLSHKMDHVHGAMFGRNQTTNAMEHVNHRYTFAVDVKDFFGCIQRSHLVGPRVWSPSYKNWGDLYLELIDSLRHWDDELPYVPAGFNTSPVIANLAFLPVDFKIMELFPNCRYTRYVDDLYLSFDDYAQYAPLKRFLPRAMSDEGFSLNHKTRLMDQKRGRRIVTGIAIDDNGKLCPRRSVKRRIRAMAHGCGAVLIDDTSIAWNTRASPPGPELRGLCASQNFREPREVTLSREKLYSRVVEIIGDPMGVEELVEEMNREIEE